MKQQRATQKAKLASKSKLSFLGNEEDVEEADDNNEDAVTAAALPNLPTLEAGPTKKRAKLGEAAVTAVIQLHHYSDYYVQRRFG